jgi:arginine-tRNA-protein transferase
MKYILEGKLIGIGVVDMVDDGISSVYFFYDPAYKEYRLGVFSSIIEIEYVRWMRLSFPEFRYYYMGFYIPNSKKMNYKGKNKVI